MLTKLAEDVQMNQFVNKGTNYITNINTHDYMRGTMTNSISRYPGRSGSGSSRGSMTISNSGSGGGSGSGSGSGSGLTSVAGDSRRASGHRDSVGSGGSGVGVSGSGIGSVGGTSMEDISASTTISMAVPELLVGNILGKNVRQFLVTFFLVIFNFFFIFLFNFF